MLRIGSSAWRGAFQENSWNQVGWWSELHTDEKYAEITWAMCPYSLLVTINLILYNDTSVIQRFWVLSNNIWFMVSGCIISMLVFKDLKKFSFWFYWRKCMTMSKPLPSVGQTLVRPSSKLTWRYSQTLLRRGQQSHKITMSYKLSG